MEVFLKKIGDIELLDDEVGFRELGIDSLQMIGIRQEIQYELGDKYYIPHTLLLDSPNLKILTGDILKILNLKNTENTVEILKQEHNDFNWRSNTTAFLLACGEGSISLVEIFLDENVDVNECDKDGRNAIFICVLENQVEVAKILLAYGADINYQNNNGVSALKCALNMNRKEILNVFESLS